MRVLVGAIAFTRFILEIPHAFSEHVDMYGFLKIEGITSYVMAFEVSAQYIMTDYIFLVISSFLTLFLWVWLKQRLILFVYFVKLILFALTKHND